MSLFLATKNAVKSVLPENLYNSLRRKVLWLLNYRLVNLTENSVFIGKATYYHDHLMTVTNSDFVDDARFKKAYTALESVYQGTAFETYKFYWRMHVIFWAASHAKHLEGDFVDCGVYKGGFARAVIDYIDFNSTGKSYWLLDTFEGIEPKYLTEEEKKLGLDKIELYEDSSYETVVKTFEPFPTVHVIKGPVPDTLPQVKSDKIAYISIDMNNVQPEIAAGEYFWDKLVSGGMIVLDDYGWRAWIVSKRGWDEFAARKGVEVLSLPTGQGVIIKP